MAKSDGMDKSLSRHGSGVKPKGHVHAVHVRRASGGGYIATHTMQDQSGKGLPDQEHVIPDADALQDHMQAAMGDQPPAGSAPGGGDPSMGGGGAPEPGQAA